MYTENNHLQSLKHIFFLKGCQPALDPSNLNLSARELEWNIHDHLPYVMILFTFLQDILTKIYWSSALTVLNHVQHQPFGLVDLGQTHVPKPFVPHHIFN